MILGYYLALHSPNKTSVLKAIRHAILPKDVQARYPDIVNPWKCFGVPTELIFDNGSDFASNDVLGALTELEIMRTLNPKGMPFLKGKIERFFKTLNYDFIHAQEGTTKANYIKNGDYKSKEKACLTFEELDHIINLWIVDHYHVKTHRGLGDSPLNVWNKSVRNYRPPTVPASLETLNYLALEQVQKTVQKSGVQFKNLKYNSTSLMEMARRLGYSTKVTLLYDRDNIAKAKVRAPDSDELIEVYCTNSDYVENGLSLREHESIMKAARDENKNKEKITKKLLIQTRRKIREITETASKRRKPKGKPKTAPKNSAERKQTSSRISGADAEHTSEIPVMNDDFTSQKNENFSPTEF
tara:strand:- start:1268 stop:2335 length:1068 start_codon:yes stop_codon:yes gene_type:complete